MRSRLRALVTLVALSPTLPVWGGVLLVANKSDHTLSFLDPNSGHTLATVPTGRHPHEVAVSPDGALAVVSNYGDRDTPGASLTVVDIQARAVLRTIELGEHRRPHGLAFLPDGRLLVTAEGSGHLLVVRPREGELQRAVPTGQEVSHMVVAAGARAFVANIGSGTVTVLDLERAEKVRDVPTGAGAEGIAVSPDGREVWVANRADDTLVVFDAGTLEILARIDCPGFPIRVAFTPEGDRVWVSCPRSGEVAVFEARARKLLRRIRVDLSPVGDAGERLFGDAFGRSPVPVGLLVEPGGARVFVAATQADAIVVVGTESSTVQGLLRAGREPDGMAYAR